MLSFFKPQYTTPYYTVLIIGGLSAVIGSAAALGGLPVLMGIILAANLGAMLLYAGLCGLTIAAFYKTPEFHFGRHILRPGIGLAVNLAVVIAFPIIGIQSGGVTEQASLLALGIAFFWLLASLGYYRTTRTR
jgi:4-hydroxybenzoate polyprenyltransferase